MFVTKKQFKVEVELDRYTARVNFNKAQKEAKAHREQAKNERAKREKARQKEENAESNARYEKTRQENARKRRERREQFRQEQEQKQKQKQYNRSRQEREHYRHHYNFDSGFGAGFGAGFGGAGTGYHSKYIGHGQNRSGGQQFFTDNAPPKVNDYPKSTNKTLNDLLARFYGKSMDNIGDAMAILCIKGDDLSAGIVKKAYRKLSLQYHPDKFKPEGLSDAEATLQKKQYEEIFKLISNANTALEKMVH
ncbi:J domain-containing protein [Endozoicomonas ascidiicola]|uniref:J domain-containing protein n=1 Tax=Endozoicomonas ascidiicola TaxID=1698521 RepID=UPI00082D6C33|nr:J domain-containing protein [Endozoicomonas ascidiicola]